MILGIDVGGANIKLAGDNGYSFQLPFALWEQPHELEGCLRRLIRESPNVSEVVLTMTGELTDSYHSKAEGVREIVAAATGATDRPVVVYQIGNIFAQPEVAIHSPKTTAAANWYALASFAATLQEVNGRSGLLIDIGSTTTDIIPFSRRRCLAKGHNDFERLVHGELVYTGAIRSPLCGILQRLRVQGQMTRVMNELFANMLDVNVLLGQFAEGMHAGWTADRTNTRRKNCMLRLARMAGLDLDSCTEDDVHSIAIQFRDAQLAALVDAANHVISQSSGPEVVVLSGEGEFTGAELCQRLWPDSTSRPQILSFNSLFDAGVSRCAPAYAIACLRSARGSDPASCRERKPAAAE